MKTVAKKAIRDERGKVLILVLVLLVVGGLILTPLLGLMSTGLVAGQVYERKVAELYAADAGVEDAIWRIQNSKAEFDEDGYYSYPDPEQGVAELWVVNDKSVVVEIYRKKMPESTKCHQVYRYQILSTATSDDGGGSMIEAYLTATTDFADLSGLMDNIITIREGLTENELKNLINQVEKVEFACREGCSDECCGAVYSYEDGDACYGCGVVYNYGGWWPTPSMLSEYYLADVASGTHYDSDTDIDLKGQDRDLGPVYVDGELDILNSLNTPATLTLTGTLYITGDTLIGKTSHNFTLDLNGNTIFVESSSVAPKKALWIGGSCTTILGPGAIIAIGDIYFEPGGDVGSNEEPVFVFSVSGTTTLQPSGDFYGAVAGNFYVEAKSGKEATLTYPPGGFGDDFDFFPSMIEVNRMYDLVSWTIGPA